MTTPSIFSAFLKLKDLLTKEDKIKLLGIAAFAVTTSVLEIITATFIIIFAQVLTQPTMGEKYLLKLGFQPGLSSERVVLYIALIAGVVYLIKNIIAGVEVFFQNFTIQKMNYNFKKRLLQRYAELDYKHYLTRNSSLGLQVVGGDTELMFTTGMVSVAIILSESVIFLSLIGMIVYLNPSLALAIFCIAGGTSFGIAKGLLPRFYRFGQRLQEASLLCSQNLLQFFHGFKEIILLGKREAFIDAYQLYSCKKSRVQALQMALNGLPRLVIELIFVGMFVTTIAFLCLENDSPSQMLGILGGYLYVGFRLMPGMNRIINQLNLFKSVIPSTERVHNEYTMIATQGLYVDNPDLKFEKGIICQNVHFKYLNAETDALDDVTLEFKKGESIGIVGETGSGKSTLVDLILGLLKPHKGSILVDGKYPVNSYQWHNIIGYVPQSIYLTDDTIEANIAFGEKDIDISKLERAINEAQLRKLIAKLPAGTKTIVGERGIRLSGGERQRIAIARALYRNPEVLIFDEATSALDNETEARLVETINAVSKNRTVIMVAHRLTTLAACQRIVVLSNGKVKEITNYKALKVG